MGRQAAADGIGVVCATPHIRHDHDVRIGELPDRVRALNHALAAAGVDVRVVAGGEVAEPIVADLTDAELRACSLGGAGWVLLEPAPGPLGARTSETVASLRRRGFRTVLAHPERHPGEDLAGRLRDVARLGALIQLTAAFVADGSADWFLDEGLVHVVASDAHSSHGGRRVELSPALRRLDPQTARTARDASRAILEGASACG
jgi:tyrosine-protein phosphatase YwqE